MAGRMRGYHGGGQSVSVTQMWSNQPREDGLVQWKGGLLEGSHVNLLCRLLPSSSPPVSTPLPTPYPLPVKVQTRLKAAMWLPAVTGSLSDCPSVCPFVYFCVCGPVRASAEDWTELLWSILGGCGAPTAVASRVFRKDAKKMTKKILVVYKFICFHGFVIIAKQSGKAACADWALNCCMLWASLTTWWQNQPTNRMEDGRWNMHCTVLKYFTWSKYPDNKSGNIPIVVNTCE